MDTETHTDQTEQVGAQRAQRSLGGSHSMAEKASAMASQATGFASRAASALASDAQEKASGLMQQQIGAGADYVRMISESAHNAAREFEGKAPELARLMHDAAERANDLADGLRQRSISDLFDQASAFARNNPRVFFGGAIAIGFMLSRFAKSSNKIADRSARARTPSAETYGASGESASNRTQGGSSYAG